MTAPTTSVRELAREIVRARNDVSCIQPPSEQDPDMTLSTAYAIAASVTSEWIAGGANVNGIKIGFTSRSKWKHLGLHGPCWGCTYDQTTREAVAEPVDLSGCVAPRLEAEIVVGISRDLEPGADTEEVAHALSWAALGFELVDCHVKDWRISPIDLVADFGAHAGLVIGERRALTPEDALRLSDVAVELRCDDARPLQGSGLEVLGGPVQAIAAVLAEPHAPRLRPGSLVSTGALTGGAHPVSPGQAWHLDALGGPLPSTTVAFAPFGGER